MKTWSTSSPTQERKAFKTLATDQEREKFVEQFWLRRDPTPGTPENEFHDEHYRRIAYANSAASQPAFRDGRPTAGAFISSTARRTRSSPIRRPTIQQRFPFEQWRYRLIEGIGNNVIMEFDDLDKTGEFHMTMDPNAPGGDELAATAREIRRLEDLLRQLRERATDGHPDTQTLQSLVIVKTQRDALLRLRNRLLEVSDPGAAAISHVAIQALTSGEMLITIPSDFSVGLQVSGRVTNGSGFSTAWFSQTLPVGSEPLAKKLSLPPGSYTLTLTVKNLTTGKTLPEKQVPFEVK